jgi:hypothetical protein
VKEDWKRMEAAPAAAEVKTASENFCRVQNEASRLRLERAINASLAAEGIETTVRIDIPGPFKRLLSRLNFIPLEWLS